MTGRLRSRRRRRERRGLCTDTPSSGPPALSRGRAESREQRCPETAAPDVFLPCPQPEDPGPWGTSGSNSVRDHGNHRVPRGGGASLPGAPPPPLRLSTGWLLSLVPRPRSLQEPVPGSPGRWGPRIPANRRKRVNQRARPSLRGGAGGAPNSTSTQGRTTWPCLQTGLCREDRAERRPADGIQVRGDSLWGPGVHLDPDLPREKPDAGGGGGRRRPCPRLPQSGRTWAAPRPSDRQGRAAPSLTAAAPKTRTCAQGGAANCCSPSGPPSAPPALRGLPVTTATAAASLCPPWPCRCSPFRPP